MNDGRTSGQRQNHGAGVSQQSSNHTSPDIAISCHGSITLFYPVTEAARNWMREHCPKDGDHTYFGGALVVESRYVEVILFLAGEDGLLV